MALINDVKKALRISHSELDSEIKRNIATAKADLIRMGVSESVVEDEEELVTQAVITYCLRQFTEDVKLMDKYQQAYELQADGLRKYSNV